MEKPTGEVGWLDVDKTKEIINITVKELTEIMERYGGHPVTYMFKKWVETYNVQDMNSAEFEEVRRRVEEMIISNSRRHD